MNIDSDLEDYLRPLFGDMSHATIEMQKMKLGLVDNLDADQYLAVAEEIRNLCSEMAGEVIAGKIHQGLVAIIEANR